MKELIKEKEAQGSGELILIFGGIIIIVLIAIISYKNYLNKLACEINSTEVNNLNSKIIDMIDYFNR